MTQLQGIAASPGIGIGPVHIVDPEEIEVQDGDLAPQSVAVEQERFRTAIQQSLAEVRELREKIALETGSRRLHTPPRFVPFCRLRCSPRRKRDFAGFSGALPVLVLRAKAQRPCEAGFPRYWRYGLVSRTGPVRTSPAKRARLGVT